MRSHRLKYTTQPERPAEDAPEGYKAAWWRERVMGFSRPQLAIILGLTDGTILRYERSEEVPKQYRLACVGLTSAIAAELDTEPRMLNAPWPPMS